ncbi:hypothetical protein [Pandoraea sp. ISTKB]|uniref:hypothetical protein n=1 Tax=Pandoraea sp. ISTKB TaxID=1586708 RepID=UPI001112D40B|nr:hypothetical protein [Pandoraea sp. ISTKB]
MFPSSRLTHTALPVDATTACNTTSTSTSTACVTTVAPSGTPPPTTPSRALFPYDFWQAIQAPLSPPAVTPTDDTLPAVPSPPPPASLPSLGLAASDWRVDFTGLFELPLSTDDAASVTRPAIGKRDFATALGGDDATHAAHWKRLSALREIPALEPKPSTSGMRYRTGPSIPEPVLRKALLVLGDPAAQASDWFATLASRAVDVVLDKGHYADAHHLLEGLLRRLESDQALAHWTTAFERVVALTMRFEARTEHAARAMLLTCSKTSGDGAQALAQASTNASIEHLVAHRLHAIADGPADRRASEWRDLLDGMQRSSACTTAQRLVPLARFIGLLSEAEQTPAAMALVEAACTFAGHGGWRELASELFGAVPTSEMAAIARTLTSNDRRMFADDVKAVVEAISERVDRLSDEDTRALIEHLEPIVMMRGDFDYLVFGPDECAQMLDDLRTTCRRRGFDDLTSQLDTTLEAVCDEYKRTMMD